MATAEPGPYPACSGLRPPASPRRQPQRRCPDRRSRNGNRRRRRQKNFRWGDDDFGWCVLEVCRGRCALGVLRLGDSTVRGVIRSGNLGRGGHERDLDQLLRFAKRRLNRDAKTAQQRITNERMNHRDRKRGSEAIARFGGKPVHAPYLKRKTWRLQPR